MIEATITEDNEDKRPNVNLIEDNNFMDKDVSELVFEDFYLFAIIEDTVYFYYQGKVWGTFLDNDSYSEFTSKPYKYTKGTLNELYGELKAQKVVLRY